MKKNEALICSVLVFGCVFFLVLGACKKSSPTSPSTPDSGLLTLSGLVSLAGSPLSGVDVYLSWETSQKKTTGSDGKFSFTGISKGNYFITPSRLGNSFSPSNFEVGSSSRTDLNFTAQTASTGVNVGTVATNFTAKDNKGNNVSLNSHHGKVVLIDFTADWCGPCREKAETAEQFYQKYKDKGFIYVLIVIDGSPSIWASTYGLTFPVLDDNSKSVYNMYKATFVNLPFPHVLDRNLTIRYKKDTWVKAEVEELINKLL